MKLTKNLKLYTMTDFVNIYTIIFDNHIVNDYIQYCF